LKINVVIDSISRAAGGLFDAERRLWQSLVVTGIGVSAFSLADEFSGLDASAWLPIVPESFPAGWPGALGRSTPFRSRLLAEPADLLYRAGLWTWPSRNAHEWRRQYDKPEIIAPHGMLDPWAVNNSAWKKKLALFFYEQEHLQNAACIRALCESEARAIRTFGLKNPICIVPNGIDVPEIGNQKTESRKQPWAGYVEPGRKVLLYLGRIHPKKGLANLIRAWSKIQKAENGKQKAEEWVLAIAGWDQGGHEDELKRLATELGIQWADVRTGGTTGQQDNGTTGPQSVVSGRWSVIFLGPQFNVAKATCYRNCDAFILPSFSEGLPMVILEAWAYGKPVLMTPQCNLPEGFAAGAAIRIEPNEESLAQGLHTLFQSSISDLQSTGARGRALVAGRFAWPKIATEMKSVYEWVLGGGAKPECVV
jgi:poly(glycerol-phosphate) alpha-glucosyltransferase